MTIERVRSCILFRFVFCCTFYHRANSPKLFNEHSVRLSILVSPLTADEQKYTHEAMLCRLSEVREFRMISINYSVSDFIVDLIFR